MPKPLDTADEFRLIAAARDGDVRAFEELYRAHVGRVFAICLRVAADRERAEELTQDVFVRAWLKIESFAGRSSLGSWLYRLAVNVAIDALRRDRRRSGRETAIEDLGMSGEPHSAADPGDRMDLESAIASLPSGARTVLVLHDIEGFRHEEIAELLRVSSGTSKAQLFRARRLLRARLREPRRPDCRETRP